MGDRAEIKIEDYDNPPFFIYTHHGGSTLLEKARAAMKAGRGRWDDPPYLAAILFTGLMGKFPDPHRWHGFGISTGHAGDVNRVLVINMQRQTVAYYENYPEDDNPPKKPAKFWGSFEAFALPL